MLKKGWVQKQLKQFQQENQQNEQFIYHLILVENPQLLDYQNETDQPDEGNFHVSIMSNNYEICEDNMENVGLRSSFPRQRKSSQGTANLNSEKELSSQDPPPISKINLESQFNS